MNWEAVGAIGEVLGAIGVIATLGYLAVQIRQNTESLRATSELGLSQQSAGWMSRMAAQPELSRIYDAAAEDPTSLTPEEISRFRWVVGELFLIYEGHYQLYRTGHIAEISWKGKDQVMQGLLENPLVAEWWNRRMTPFIARRADEGRAVVLSRRWNAARGVEAPPRRSQMFVVTALALVRRIQLPDAPRWRQSTF